MQVVHMIQGTCNITRSCKNAILRKEHLKNEFNLFSTATTTPYTTIHGVRQDCSRSGCISNFSWITDKQKSIVFRNAKQFGKCSYYVLSKITRYFLTDCIIFTIIHSNMFKIDEHWKLSQISSMGKQALKRQMLQRKRAVYAILRIWCISRKRFKPPAAYSF